MSYTQVTNSCLRISSFLAFDMALFYTSKITWVRRGSLAAATAHARVLGLLLLLRGVLRRSLVVITTGFDWRATMVGLISDG